MRLKNLVIYSTYLSSIILLILPNQISLGCSGGWDPDDSEIYYSFFQQEIMDILDLNPSEYQNQSFKTEDNLNEWSDYFGESVDNNAINSFFYNGTLEDIQDVSIGIKEGNDLNVTWKENLVAKYFINNPNNPALDYFIYSKKCEPHATYSGYWYYDDRDTTGIGELISEGYKLYNNCTNELIKQRYAYQMVRMNHYRSNYSEVIRCYDEYMAPMGLDNMINYWGLSNKAGALLHLDRGAESLRWFATVFGNCSNRQTDILNGIKYKDDQTFKDALNLCETNDEKATVWLMLALKPHSHRLESMQEIYKLSPKSYQLENLLAMEIEDVEDLFLGSKLMWSEYADREYSLDDSGSDYDIYDDITNRNMSEYLKEFNEFVNMVADNKKTRTPSKWYLSAGYLSYLNSDYEKMHKYFKKTIRKNKDNQLIADQVKLVETMVYYDTITTVDSNVETRALQDLKLLTSLKSRVKREEAKAYIIQKLENLYNKDRRKRSVELCRYYLTENYYYYEDEVAANFSLEEEFTWFKDSAKTQMEKYLLQWYPLSLGDFYEIFGTNDITIRNWESAYANLKLAKEHGFKAMQSGFRLDASPFTFRISDCHDCDFNDSYDQSYDKLKFVEQMLELDSLAQVDPSNKSQYYFEIGNAFYNMSHFGNSTRITGSGRSAYEYENFYGNYYWNDNNELFEHDKSKYNETVNLSKYAPMKPFDYDGEDAYLYFEEMNFSEVAQLYYVDAYRNTTDRELKAKYCFAAAKCEQIQYYDQVGSHDPEELLNFRTFFKKIDDEFSDTEFYNEAIKECKYFRWFTQN